MSSWSLWSNAEFGGVPLSWLIPKVLYAVICGGIIGLERELKHKAAGIKTNILICLGSMIFTVVSILFARKTPLGDANPEFHSDPARVAAQIVSGIGFLGGGAIIQARGTVLGLTTAATIWVVAAIGMTVGLGYHGLALGASSLTVIILVGASFFEDRVLGRNLVFQTELTVFDPEGTVRQEIKKLLSYNDLSLEGFDVSTRGREDLLLIRYLGHRKDQKKFALSLWATQGVKQIKQL